MGYEKFYPLTVKADWTHDQLLKVLSATVATGYSDITLVLPNQAKSLQTLDNFYSLQRTGRELRIELTISGGSKTARNLARLLHFRVIEDPDDVDSPAEKEYRTANQFWNQPPAAETTKAKTEADPSLLLAIAFAEAIVFYALFLVK